VKTIILKFIIYSFLGCITEIIYCALLTGEYESRKCMLLCFACPVYGLGGVMITKAAKYLNNNSFLIFITGAFAATFAEYVTHYFYDKALNVRFWDYTNYYLNVNGRVCLMYTLIWGLLSLIIVKFVEPHVDRIAVNIRTPLAAAILIIFTADTFFSLYLLGKYETRHAINIFMLLRAYIN